MAKDSKLLFSGDVLVVDVRPIASGIVNLVDYTDVLNGITAERFVYREFRLSMDSIFYTDWEELTDLNLSNHSEKTESEFLIQIKYTRQGADNTGEIEFVKIDFIGTFIPVEFIAPTINSSIFSEISVSDEVKSLERNIFKKLYYRGIIPKYIIRADNIDKNDDEDYITLFSSIARFFAMIFRFHKRYENLHIDFDLLREYVRQNGIYFNESNITLEELQYLAQHFYDEIRKRGTNMIFKRKGETLLDGTIVPIDGEFIRLLRNKGNDEFLYEYIPLDKIGWNLGNCSPIYRGTCETELLNKTKENTQDFISADNFHLTKSGYSDYYVTTFDNKKVLYLVGRGLGSAGIGRIANESVDDNLIKVDSGLDYEITFMMKVMNGTSDYLRFEVEGFDSLKNKLFDSFITPNGDQITDIFAAIPVEKFVVDTWYKVRGIIHAYSSSNTDNILLNIGFGNNLYFNNKFVKYISPKIKLQSYNSSAIQIWDYKIRPLVRGTNILPLKSGLENSHSLGFIQCPKLFYVYVKNNNNSLSEKEVRDIIDKYLLSFNMNSVFVFVSNY